MIRLVVFDLAGTLVEDHGEVLVSVTSALERQGIQVPTDEIREWRGASKRDVIRHFIERHTDTGAAGATGDRVDRTYADFRRLLAEQYATHGITPIAGAARTLDWLGDRGIRIAATTGFDRDVADLILARAGWQQPLANLVCGSDVPLGRPAPYMIFRAMEAARVTNVREVAVVGDTPLDLQAESNAGVKTIVGVLTGAHGEARLRREPHTHILSGVGALPDLIARELERTAPGPEVAP
ncbi:MAG: HAD hydrolase-like protein [Acidobacteriota bacterium]|nr:HAD hydrolase-like protein [Acidobacteriota bacterium]